MRLSLRCSTPFETTTQDVKAKLVDSTGDAEWLELICSMS